MIIERVGVAATGDTDGESRNMIFSSQISHDEFEVFPASTWQTDFRR